MQIEQLWAELLKSPGPRAFKRVDDLHPLDLYAGCEVSGERYFMLVTNEEPPAPPRLDAVEISRNHRHDGRWVLLFRLHRDEFRTPFALICQDLIESSRTYGGSTASAYLLTRLDRWRKLLQQGSSATLGESELRGLVGELIFLERYAMPIWGSQTALAGWGGPFGAAQDFAGPGFNVEVKTRRPNQYTVRISAVDQLESSLPLYLVVISLGPANGETEGQFTPASLIRTIREMLRSDSQALTQFELCLATAGYSEHDDYELIHFVVSQIQVFEVLENFPRLRSAVVPHGISTVTYQLDLTTCQVFVCDLPGVPHGT